MSNKKHKDNNKIILTKEDKEIVCDLICNEQIKYLLKNGQYASEEYLKLEKLKAKIKAM